MINKDSIVTAYDEHLTLVEWLQKVENALNSAVLTNLGIAKLSDKDNVATYQVTATFADNTTIASDSFTLPSTDIVTAFDNLKTLVNGFDTRITHNTSNVENILDVVDIAYNQINAYVLQNSINGSDDVIVDVDKAKEKLGIHLSPELQGKIAKNTADIEKKQDKLTAGDGITISGDNTISVPTSTDFSNRFAGGDIICNYYWIYWQDGHYLDNVTDLSYCFYGATLYTEPYEKPEYSTVKFHDMPKAVKYTGIFSHVKKTHAVELGTIGFEGNSASSGLLFYNSEFAKISVREGCTVWCANHWDNVFCDCPNLVSVTGNGCFDLSAVTMIPNLITNSPKVKDLSGLKHFRVSFDISPSTAFEKSDLVTIISNLDPVTTAQTLTMGATNLAKLTDDEKKVATDKNWVLA